MYLRLYTTKIVKIPTIFHLMHGDMFRLCLQPSSGQLVVQSRYKYCVYGMGSHKVYMCIILSHLYYLYFMGSHNVRALFVPTLYYKLA